ncbi:hypothetical protein C8R45DRAFT_1076513 [Mycena sanguinolenta]|nr:hypothetical protein C8R45DRAFT_1076513 [Mycena sanguinolenta]
MTVMSPSMSCPAGYFFSNGSSVASNFAVGDDGGITRSGNAEASDAEAEEEPADATAPVIGRGRCNRYSRLSYYLQEELSKEREALQRKIEARKGQKKPRKQKGKSREFPSHLVFIVDEDSVNPDAPGLKVMLDDEEEAPKAGSETEPSRGESPVNWAW